jgi:hypothetical protein
MSELNTCIFYRGQACDWALRPTLYRHVKTRADVAANEHWLDDTLTWLTDRWDPKGTRSEREALAQHYGLPTRWLDVVNHLQMACWFAHQHDAEPGGDLLTDTISDSVGYIYVLACPVDGGEAMCRDLRIKPSTWLRPHVQEAFVLKKKEPGKRQGELSTLHVATFIR